MEELFIKLKSLISDYELQYQLLIEKAYYYASSYHHGQFRQSGEPYVTHPLHVAITLAEMKADADMICAGLLHDTLEDTALSQEIIENEFNPEVAKLVLGVTNISNTSFSSIDEAKQANDRKLVLSLTQDIRIVIIKLADRLHNMMTLEYKQPEKRKRTSYETIDVFAPLANYIGAYQMKSSLEDLALKYLQEDNYYHIKEELSQIKDRNNDFLNNVVGDMSQILISEGIKSDIVIGNKNIYGINKRKNLYPSMEYIPGLFSLKISVNNIKDCYYALGLIAQKYPPRSGMIEDLISNPLHNTYRSLHTNFRGENNLLIQSQIRTYDMSLIAAYGLTAYWKLNPINAREKMQEELRSQFQDFESIKRIDSTFTDNQAFLEQIRRQLFSEKIKIYSPNRSTYYLPSGSRIKDFIRQLDTDLINNVVRTFVNGSPISVDSILNEGDQVSIYVNKNIDNSNNYNGFIITEHVKKLTLD